jgi:starch phosphorylase
MVLHIISQYNKLKNNPGLTIPPRVYIFGGKAAPGYFMAKRIIKMINAVGETVNADPDVNRYMKVVFLPNFNVKSAHLVYPAANLSEQISTAGKEASGTGNMKFMINGALTIGTLDGANVEIREEAGPENFFLFGLTEDQVERVKSEGYRPASFVENDPELAEVLQLIAEGRFTHGDTEILKPVLDSLLYHDPFLALADYRAYVDCQDKVSAAWEDGDRWAHMSILNTARSGKFSSDRAIAQYCEDIWKVWPMQVDV